MHRICSVRRVALALVGGLVALASFGEREAHAQPKPITIGVVTIVGRVQKPVAAVDVSRIAPKLTLMELKQPFLERIEEATKGDPF